MVADQWSLSLKTAMILKILQPVVQTKFVREIVSYLEKICSIISFIMWTRVDLSVSLGRLVQACKRPTLDHCIVLSRVLRYVKAPKVSGFESQERKQSNCAGTATLTWPAAMSGLERLKMALFRDGSNSSRSVLSYSDCRRYL